MIGSTYEYKPWTEDQALEQNINKNLAYLPQTYTVAESQHGSRTVSSDRNPVVGQVQEHLWVSTAHGSMGTSSAPYAAAIIAAAMTHRMPVAGQRECQLIAPERFITRQARRGRRY